MSLTYVSKRLIGSGGPATLSIVSDVDVAVLAVDGCFDSGLSAVVDVLATANALRQEVPAPPTPFTVSIVGLKKQVRTGNGLIVHPVPAKKLTQPPDLLIMPALGVKTPQEIVDTVRGHAALDLIRNSHANGAELAGACTGTFFLAESGVLDGLLATTSWWLGPAFRARYPAVLLDETRIRSGGSDHYRRRRLRPHRSGTVISCSSTARAWRTSPRATCLSATLRRRRRLPCPRCSHGQTLRWRRSNSGFDNGFPNRCRSPRLHATLASANGRCSAPPPRSLGCRRFTSFNRSA
jgi:putative intracellular protease/amidase